MAKWPRSARSEDVKLLLRAPELLRDLYVTFVDASPVVGKAQMVCELFRLIDGGNPAGGLQGAAATRRPR